MRREFGTYQLVVGTRRYLAESHEKRIWNYAKHLATA
jgi:hypothetical protein